MNANWKRWIFASVSKHFDAGKGDIASFHIQGSTRNLEQNVERGEFRISGLEISELSKNEFRLQFVVNILVTVPISSEFHRIHVLTGRFANLFGPIAIQKLGDDSSTIGCVTLIREVDIVDFGQLSADVKVNQSTVEGHFSIELAGE